MLSALLSANSDGTFQQKLMEKRGCKKLRGNAFWYRCNMQYIFQYILLHTFQLDRGRVTRPNATYRNDNSYIFKRIFRIFRTFIKNTFHIGTLAFVKGIFYNNLLPLKWCKLIYKIIYPICIKQATMCFPKRNRLFSWVIILKIVFRNFRI